MLDHDTGAGISLIPMICDEIMGVNKDSLHKSTWHSCLYMSWNESTFQDMQRED